MWMVLLTLTMLVCWVNSGSRSFSIQSALQESARAHFESKKSQQRTRQRDREKERAQRAAVAASVAAGHSVERNRSPSASSFRSRPPPPVRVEETLAGLGVSLVGPNRSTSMAQASSLASARLPSPSAITTTMSAKKSSSSGAAPPSSQSQSFKPLISPTNSLAARTVSQLMSKDQEAIQDFRTRSGSGATSLSSSTTGPIMAAHSPNLHTQFFSESPTGGISSGGSSSRLLPLQLSSTASERTAVISAVPLRPRRSTGNLIPNAVNAVSNHGHAVGSSDGRNRAGSTDSDKSLAGGGGHSYREGLSRLRYLKGGHGAGLRPPPLVLESVPGSPIVVERGGQGVTEGEFDESGFQDA